MSQAVKENPQTVSEENDSDALSKEISRSLELDDFVWVENTSPEVISHENVLENGSELRTEPANVAQHGTNTESSENTEECPLESNADIESSEIIPSEWERGLSVEQQYWDEYGSVVKNANSSQPKYPASQRLTMKEHGKIDNDKRSDRDPSHYKFDYATTVLLKKVVEQKHAGPYHNVVGRGSNSVVIFAKYPASQWTHLAVKVYKLSNNVDKNNAIFKRAQREYEHLTILKYQGHIPTVYHRMKNIIVTWFIGEDQETAQSMTVIPSNYSKDLYEIIVREMAKWYKKFNLVHGNLCSKNIVYLYYDQSYHTIPYILYFLGWSHSVKASHPRALVKLMRDCQFVTNFFKKRGVPVKSSEELFKDITYLDEISEVLKAMRKKDLWQEKHPTNPNRECQKGYIKKQIYH